MNETYDELASLIVYGLDMEKKIASGNIRRLNAADEKWLPGYQPSGFIGSTHYSIPCWVCLVGANALIFGF